MGKFDAAISFQTSKVASKFRDLKRTKCDGITVSGRTEAPSKTILSVVWLNF